MGFFSFSSSIMNWNSSAINVNVYTNKIFIESTSKAVDGNEWQKILHSLCENVANKSPREQKLNCTDRQTVLGYEFMFSGK